MSKQEWTPTLLRLEWARTEVEIFEETAERKFLRSRPTLPPAVPRGQKPCLYSSLLHDDRPCHETGCTHGRTGHRGGHCYACGTRPEPDFELTEARAQRELGPSTPPTFSESVCVVCINNLASVRTAPCGHVALCTGCRDRVSEDAIARKTLMRCPICRVAIESSEVVFFKEELFEFNSLKIE